MALEINQELSTLTSLMYGSLALSFFFSFVTLLFIRDCGSAQGKQEWFSFYYQNNKTIVSLAFAICLSRSRGILTSTRMVRGIPGRWRDVGVVVVCHLFVVPVCRAQVIFES